MLRRLAGSFVLLFAVAPVGRGAEPGTEILNTHSFWRCHVTLRPPLYGTAADAKSDPKEIPKLWRLGPTMPVTQPWSPLPPADWAEPEFDDAGWWRQPAPFPGIPLDSDRLWNHYGDQHPLGVAVLCARGKFTVTDPALVKGLSLSATYRGGLVVYLNGKEALRRHLPAGPLTLETLAEPYPPEIFVLPKVADHRPEFKAEYGKKAPLRVRRVGGEPLPVNLLRKGTNVLAVEVHRPALTPAPHRWNACALVEVELRSSGSGAVPNLTRPRSRVQVWNANMAVEVTDVDYGDPHERLGPVSLVAVRGGVFSGQVVVSSDRPLTGLRAGAAELRHEGGKGSIPAERVRIYYPCMNEATSNQNPRYPWKGTWKPIMCNISEMKSAGALLDAPPAEVKVVQKRHIADGYPYVWGAVQPVWVSVEVPRDAEPGLYKGALKVSAAGLPETAVPLEVRICPWTLPKPQEFATFVDFIQSPDSLARHYKVPLWGEEHWELMGRTFDLLGQVGNKTLYVPVITPTHFGNSETMVRWVDKGGGRYDYDFGLVGKYLDLCEKHCGKPRVVCLYAWDVYLGGEVHRGTGGMGPHAQKFKEKTVGVTKLDPGSGRVETMQVPAFGDGAEELWAPFGKALMEFMDKRGLKEEVMLGIAGDIRPTKEQVELWKKVLPEVKWVAQGHDRADHLYGVPVSYSSSVFGCRYGLQDPELKRLYGWQRPNVTTIFPRVLRVERWKSLMYFRLLPEWNIAGWQNGVGRIAADFFPKPRFEIKASWGNASLDRTWLSPGAKGALPTADFVMLREGIQECEARIFIERALTDPVRKARLGADLAGRCQKRLDERTRYLMWVFDLGYLNYNTGGAMLGKPLDLSWYAGSGWQYRAERLYDAAAEVGRALGIESAPPPAPRPAEKPTPAPAPAPAPTAEPAEPSEPAATGFGPATAGFGSSARAGLLAAGAAALALAAAGGAAADAPGPFTRRASSLRSSGPRTST